MIDTVAIKFGEYDPNKIANELKKMQNRVDKHVLDVLKKSPRWWFRFDAITKERKIFRNQITKYRISLTELKQYCNTYSVNDICIERWTASHGWVKINGPISKIIEDVSLLTLGEVVGEIKRQAIEIMEMQTNKICSHTAALDDTRKHDEIIEQLNHELRLASEV
tara:strand:- start:95 stop:589 length:495 start_codon:yes stop_codon:yes gene_type:complete